MLKERFKKTRIAYPVKFYYEYYVTGRGGFPFDMLRYDACWPADSTAAFKLDDNGGGRDLRSVKLHSYSEPTLDRWSSFGWSVGLEDLGRKA